MEQYQDLLNLLGNSPNNNVNNTGNPDYSGYLQSQGFNNFESMVKEGQSGMDNLVDFVGGTLWGLADTATFGIADYLDLDQLVMGGEAEDVFADPTYSQAERQAFGTGLPTTAAQYGQTIGNIAAFMLPGQYPKIPGVKTRIPIAPQAITGQFVSQPVARATAKVLPESWFKGKVGVKGITPVKQKLKETEIAKKAGLEGNIQAANFNAQLSKGLWQKVQRAKVDPAISNPANFVKGSREYIEEAVKQKVNQGILTRTQGDDLIRLWTQYYNKRPIQDFIDVFSTRYPGPTGKGLGSILHEALMFGSMDGIKERFHSWDEERPYDWHMPQHGAALGAAFGGMKLVLPKVGLGFTTSQSKGLFKKDAMGRSDFRAGMSAYWKPDKFFEGKTFHQLRQMSKWFGKSNRFGVDGKYSRTINIDGVVDDFNFSRPRMEADRWLRNLKLEVTDESREILLKKALRSEAKLLGKDIMKASLSEEWNALSFIHAGIGSAIMNNGELINLYQSGWDATNKQDFIFNMVVGAWLNRHGYAKRKDHNEARMKRLRSGLENLGVNMKHIGEIIPSYDVSRDNFLDPLSYDARLKRISQKMDNMGMSVENIENISTPLPLGEKSAAFSTRDLSVFKQFYKLYATSGNKRGFARDLESISEKDALEIQNTIIKEFGSNTIFGMADYYKQAVERAESSITDAIVNTGAEAINNIKIGFEIKSSGSTIPKEIDVDSGLQKAIKEGKYDDIIAEGRKLSPIDRVEILNDIDVSLNAINEFIAENQLTSKRSDKALQISEQNFESIYKAIKGGEKIINENTGNTGFDFKFSDMHGMARQINIAKGKRLVTDFVRKFERDPEINPEWNEWEAALNTAGIFKKSGINQTIVRDVSTLPIVDGKKLAETTGNDTKLVELRLFRNFVNNILSAKGFPVRDNVKKTDGTYEGVTVQQLRELQLFFESKGIPTDPRFIDTIGHEIVYDILKRNVEGSNLDMQQLKFAMDFSTELGRQTGEVDVFSLFEYNPIRSDKANGWTGRLLQTSHLSGENLSIARKYNEAVRKISKDSETVMAGKLVKVNEGNRVYFRSKETFRTIEQMMSNVETQGTESARKILIDAIEAIEGTSTLKDILGSISAKNYKDPHALKYASSLLMKMDVLRKVNKNGEDVWVVDNKRLAIKKTRQELLNSLENYGINFTEIEQIIGNARKYINDQIGSQIDHFGTNATITPDQFFKKYFPEADPYNTDLNKTELRNEFFKNRIFRDPVGEVEGGLSNTGFREIVDRLRFKNDVEFDNLSAVQKKEVIQDIQAVRSTYVQSESFPVYSYNRGTFKAKEVEKSGFKNPFTDFFIRELELNLKGYLDGITFDDVTLGDTFRPLQRIDILEINANKEMLNPKLNKIRDQRALKVQQEIEAQNMWKFVLGNSKQVLLLDKASYSGINKAFVEMYKRVVKDLLDVQGNPRQSYRHAYQKLEALYNKITANTEFDLDLHTEALKVLTFENFMKGSQRNDFIKYLNARSGDGVIQGVLKRFNLIWTPSAKRTSREELNTMFDFALNTGALNRTEAKVVQKYLGREAGKEYNIAVVNDVAPDAGDVYSGKYSQRETFDVFVNKYADMWKKNNVTPPDWNTYSGGRKEVSTYDSITFISKDMARFLSLVSGVKGKNIFKPIVSSHGENTFLYGKTVFVYDPNLSNLFKGKNSKVDMVMMGTADKMKAFSENYTELTPEQLLQGAKIDNLMSLPLESIGMIKVPDKVTPSKLSATIMQNYMSDAEVDATFKEYHKRELENAVEMINEVMSRPSYEAEMLKLVKGMKGEDLHEMIANGGSGSQLGTLMSYMEIAGAYARPSALGQDMILNQFKKSLIDQALAPYTQKSDPTIKNNWGQKMVLSKSPYYEGKNALDPTMVDANGRILSYGEAVPAYSAREGNIEFGDGAKDVYLISREMVKGEYEIVRAKDVIYELTGAQKLSEQIYEVKVDMFEHPSLMSVDTRTGRRDRADVWVVDNLAQANEQLAAMKKGKGKAKNFANKFVKNKDGGWILKHKFGDHKYIFIKGSEPQMLIPDSKGRTKGELYKKTKFSGEGTEVWDAMANSAEPLGALHDFIRSVPELSKYDISMEFLRYPRTRPNDFTLLRIKEFLKRDAGNQLVLNPLDVWQIFEGDYDVDMGDAFWGTTREMLDATKRGVQQNVIGINTDGIDVPASRIELASENLAANRKAWENYDANSRVMQRGIGAVQNLVAPLNSLHNKAALSPDGKRVLLRYPAETPGTFFQIEIDYNPRDFKIHMAQNAQEIIDLLQQNNYGAVTDRLLFPAMEGSVTSSQVKDLSAVGFNNTSRSDLGNQNRKPFRAFVKRLVTAEGFPVKEGKNDFELELYDKLMVKELLNHGTKLSSVMPGRQKFGNEGSKQVGYEDMLSTWESYVGGVKNIDDMLFKSVYYYQDPTTNSYIYRNNSPLMGRLFGVQPRTFTDRFGNEKSYNWRTASVIPDKVIENYNDAINYNSSTGSFAEKALNIIYRDGRGKSIDNHVMNGDALRRYIRVENLLLDGNGVSNADVDAIMATLPEMIKDVNSAKFGIIRLKRSAAKVAASNKSFKQKKYILDKLNAEIAAKEEELRPLLSREYTKNPTIKNLPEFNLVDITTSEDILESTSQAFAIWNLWGQSGKGKMAAIDAKVRDIVKAYKKDYRELFSNAGLENMSGRRLRDNELTDYLLNPKDIETIETEIYNQMYDGYMKFGQAFLYRFVGNQFMVSKNGVGVYNNRPVPLFTKPNTNYKRMIKFLVRLRNGQIETMDHKIANAEFINKIDNTIRLIAKQDYLWRTFFQRKSFIEDIPFKEIRMFHQARNNPEFHYNHLQMFQNYQSSPIGKLYDNRTSGGMGKDYDKTMNFFRDLLTEAGIKDAATIDGNAKLLSYIQELEINNQYMHPFKYLTLMKQLDPKIKPIVEEVFPGLVANEGISPAFKNRVQYNDFFALMGGGRMNGQDGFSFSPSFGMDGYTYSAIKRLITQGQSIQKLNKSSLIEAAKQRLQRRELKDENKKSEDQKRREICKNVK
tara:strand:- start:8276 stop:17356 length:9081 start_codon:yes stop_codon:yes gene_type:complete